MMPSELMLAVAYAAAGMAVTEWYEGEQLPARSGVYETEIKPHINMIQRNFRYFDGERWYYGGDTPAKAMYAFQTLGIVMNDSPRWRGLREKA